MAPSEVTYDNQEEIFHKLFNKPKYIKSQKAKLRVNDYVRISRARGAFERGFTPNWSEEVYKIRKVHLSKRPLVYELEDLAGEDLIGTFYQKELQKVDKPELFRVREELARRKRGKNTEVLVSWLGYPDSFNSWVSTKDFA